MLFRSGGFQNNTPEYVVPAGHYFMMGDNRDNSQDSRFLDAVGYVPYENLVGRADIIFFSIDGVCPDPLPDWQPGRLVVGTWCTIKNSVRFGRLFSLVR